MARAQSVAGQSRASGQGSGTSGTAVHDHGDACKCEMHAYASLVAHTRSKRLNARDDACKHKHNTRSKRNRHAHAHVDVLSPQNSRVKHKRSSGLTHQQSTHHGSQSPHHAHAGTHPRPGAGHQPAASISCIVAKCKTSSIESAARRGPLGRERDATSTVVSTRATCTYGHRLL